MLKEVVPYAGIFEAPSVVKDGSDRASKRKQKKRTRSEEQQRYHQLFQDFTQRAKRWHEGMSTPEYSLGEDGRELGDSHSPYGYRNGFMLVYMRSVDGTRILPKWGHEGQIPDERPWLLVSTSVSRDLIGYRAMFDMRIRTLATAPEPLLDPYDNSPITTIEIKARIFDDIDAYSLDVVKSGTSTGKAFAVLWDKDAGYNIPESSSSDPDTLLSLDHATALFDLVDSLIPQASPQLPASPTQ